MASPFHGLARSSLSSLSAQTTLALAHPFPPFTNYQPSITVPAMAPIPPLFTIPVTGSKGSVVATQPSARIYLITFNSPPDNRLTPSFLSSFMLALDILEYRFPTGVVVTTSAIPKFYSNGLDFENALKTKGFFERMLYPLWRRLLT